MLSPPLLCAVLLNPGTLTIPSLASESERASIDHTPRLRDGCCVVALRGRFVYGVMRERMTIGLFRREGERD